MPLRLAATMLRASLCEIRRRRIKSSRVRSTSCVRASFAYAPYVRAHLLCIDEVGYLSYDARHADLLFEVVTRRYEKNRSIS